MRIDEARIHAPRRRKIHIDRHIRIAQKRLCTYSGLLCGQGRLVFRPRINKHSAVVGALREMILDDSSSLRIPLGRTHRASVARIPLRPSGPPSGWTLWNRRDDRVTSSCCLFF